MRNKIDWKEEEVKLYVGDKEVKAVVKTGKKFGESSLLATFVNVSVTSWIDLFARISGLPRRFYLEHIFKCYIEVIKEMAYVAEHYGDVTASLYFKSLCSDLKQARLLYRNFRHNAKFNYPSSVYDFDSKWGYRDEDLFKLCKLEPLDAVKLRKLLEDNGVELSDDR